MRTSISAPAAGVSRCVAWGWRVRLGQGRVGAASWLDALTKGRSAGRVPRPRDRGINHPVVRLVTSARRACDGADGKDADPRNPSGISQSPRAALVDLAVARREGDRRSLACDLGVAGDRSGIAGPGQLHHERPLRLEHTDSASPVQRVSHSSPVAASASPPATAQRSAPASTSSRAPFTVRRTWAKPPRRSHSSRGSRWDRMNDASPWTRAPTAGSRRGVPDRDRRAPRSWSCRRDAARPAGASEAGRAGTRRSRAGRPCTCVRPPRDRLGVDQLDLGRRADPEDHRVGHQRLATELPPRRGPTHRSSASSVVSP